MEFQRFIFLVEKTIGISFQEGKDDLINDYAVDSMDLIVLVTQVEETYGFEFDTDDLDMEIISNINKLYKIIKERGNISWEK